MARIILLCLAFAYSGPCVAQVSPSTDKAIRCVLSEATAIIGVKEQGGNNRGPMVDVIIRNAGGKPGQSWCSYTLIYVWKRCNLAIQGLGGMALTWAKPDRRIWNNAQVRQTDVFTIYNRYLGRIGHVGMVYELYPEEPFFKSFEGNVNAKGERESVGSSVACLMREYRAVSGFYRWVK